MIFFVSAAFFASAQKITVKGKASSYARLDIPVFVYKNFLFFDTLHLKKFKVNPDGTFEFKIRKPEQNFILLDLDYYYAMLFFDTSKIYDIRLPIHKSRTTTEKLNPYFEHEILPALVINPPVNLNNTIAKFNGIFNKNLQLYLLKKKRKLYDTLFGQVENFKPGYDDSFFNAYKTFKIAAFQYYANPQQKKQVIKKYMANSPVLYDNIAYFSLFNSLFQDFFDPQKTDLNKKIIFRGLKAQDFVSIREYLKTIDYLGTNDEFAELVIIKGIYDLFYQIPEAQKDIIKIFLKLSQQSDFEGIRKLANQVYVKLTTLETDYPAPEFSLPDKNGKIKTLRDFNGKFVYLQFCHPESYACQMQLQLLEKYSKTRPKYLEIVTVFVSDSLRQMQDFLKKNKFDWTFLFWNHDYEVLKKYNVKAFPTYYLIYPDGTLALNPAPTPEENLSQAFAVSVKKWYEKQQQTTIESER